jgi:uncharacterized protein YciI
MRKLLGLALCGAFAAHGALAAPTVAIAAFDYSDTSGEVRDQRAAHAARLDALDASIGAALQQSGRFTPVKLACATPPCSAHEMDQDSMVAAARAQHARFVVFGGVHKMSTLIQWGQVDVMDAETGKQVLSRLVTFRGDTDDAWDHAASYIGDMLVQALHG